jgi:hypothetical protein
VSFRWIEFEAYDTLFQYVDETGKICGEVRGSRFDPDKGWIAFDEKAHPSEWLGRYVDQAAAKQAIEIHFRNQSL